MLRTFPVSLAIALVATPFLMTAQSPPAQASVSVGGKKINIQYSAPSVRGRKIFGDGGVLSQDPTYPVWRAGANSATAFHTDGDLDIGGVNIPKGNYTLYISVKNPEAWELIFSKETGQWGLSYNPSMDLGRVKMTMSKPAATVEVLKYTLTEKGGNKAELRAEWERHVATVPITVK